MKKVQIHLVLTLILIFVISKAVAQGKPIACQSEEAAGLQWENKKWKSARYKPSKFILVLNNKNLTTESVAKVFETSNWQVSCTPTGITISCNTLTGEFIVFDPKTMNGGMTHLLGATMDDKDQRDSLVIEAFSCVPF